MKQLVLKLFKKQTLPQSELGEAWELVDALTKKGYTFGLMKIPNIPFWQAHFTKGDVGQWVDGESAALAIGKAALKVLL